MKPAVAIFKFAPLGVAVAIPGMTTITAVAIVVAIAVIPVHLRTDDGASRNAADNAGADFAISRLR